MLSAFTSGLMITAVLIIAIGAQNAFVLKQGLLKQHVGLVVLLCWLCDVLMISLGVYGLGHFIQGNAIASAVLALGGGLFLLMYGLRCFMAAYRGENQLEIAEEQGEVASKWKIAFATLAITLLNPHLYVDTVVLIGGSAANLSTANKAFFLIGALTTSLIWFCALGFGSRFLIPLFRRRITWRVLDTVVGIMMWYLAYGLLTQAYQMRYVIM